VGVRVGVDAEAEGGRVIVIGTTLAAYKMSGADWHSWGAWLANAEAVKASVDDNVRYFAALETDARGLVPFEPLLRRLDEIDGDYWSFSYDDRATVIDTANRLRRICAGQNMVGEWASEMRASHCLFLASDTQCRDDVLPRLLELKAPVAACHIPTYCLGVDRPLITDYAARGWDVRSHMESAACMMLRRDVFIRIKWHCDIDRNFSDDPAMHADVTELLGVPVLSRHDVLATHWPESVPAIEHRHTEEERRVYR
jgi:hypothetical protein